MRWRSAVMNTSLGCPCTLPNQHAAHRCRVSGLVQIALSTMLRSKSPALAKLYARSTVDTALRISHRYPRTDAKAVSELSTIQDLALRLNPSREMAYPCQSHHSLRTLKMSTSVRS